MYYEKWQRFDPLGTQFIHYNQLSDFVDDLEPPLRIPKPNRLLLVGMNLPICENDYMHCVDILDALTKYFLGTLDTQVTSNQNDVPSDMNKDRPKDYHPISTTAQRQREMYLSRLTLKHFRHNVEKRRNERKNQAVSYEKMMIVEQNEFNDFDSNEFGYKDN